MVETTEATADSCKPPSADEIFMAMALQAARTAAELGEVPVGAIVVKDNTVVSTAYNQPISLTDPTAHAEIMALRVAAENINNYRLPDTTLYVTLEPCVMCIGAIIHARISRLVYGAADPKSGAVQSLYTIGRDPGLNHRLRITAGVCEQECARLLRSFFQQRRKR